MKTEKRALQVLVLKVGSDADTSLGTSEVEEARNEISEILRRISSRYLDFDCDMYFTFLTLGTVREYIPAVYFLIDQWIHFLNWSIIA